MSIIEWGDKYILGIETVDEQHKKLVNILNEAYDLLMTSGPDDKVQALLQDLLSYTEIHFKSEEKMLENSNYPFYEEHLIEHKRFKSELDTLGENLSNGNISKAELVQFINNWLSDHILGNDKKYVEYINK